LFEEMWLESGLNGTISGWELVGSCCRQGNWPLGYINGGCNFLTSWAFVASQWALCSMDRVMSLSCAWTTFVHDVCAAVLVSPPGAVHRERSYLEYDARPSCLECDQGNFTLLPGTSAAIRTALFCSSFISAVSCFLEN
jgi:hypothetical protein